MLQGWKTLIIALLVAIFGALEAFDFTAFLNEQTAGWVTMGVAVVMYILRALTKTPLGKQE